MGYLECPRCESDEVCKNGCPNGHQRYLCKACRKQFFDSAGLPSFSRKCTETGLSEAIPKEIAPATTTESGGIAILLLDAENLKLKVNTEQFLAGLCDYPLQVKIAFANWKNSSIGKLDAEVYDRTSLAFLSIRLYLRCKSPSRAKLAECDRKNIFLLLSPISSVNHTRHNSNKTRSS